MNKQFLAIIIVIIVGLFGVLTFTKKDKDPNNGGSANNTAQATDHVTGKLDSKVTLTEYGDFQCPACKSYFPIITQLKTDYKDTVKFQFRHFPLVQIHQNAFIGARAAEAASRQNKFFEMHDLLYENQDTWSTASNPTAVVETYAAQLKLNTDQFKTDMASIGVADSINADVKAGQALGANSTPTFVINGKKIDKNPTSYDAFKKLLDDALAQNK